MEAVACNEPSPQGQWPEDGRRNITQIAGRCEVVGQKMLLHVNVMSKQGREFYVPEQVVMEEKMVGVLPWWISG